jgi:hypothetical protein
MLLLYCIVELNLMFRAESYELPIAIVDIDGKLVVAVLLTRSSPDERAFMFFRI